VRKTYAEKKEKGRKRKTYLEWWMDRITTLKASKMRPQDYTT